MFRFETTIRETPLLADGAIGSYLFTLTGRLSETNHVYECFNSDEPDLVKNVHTAYLRAGAQCLTTNTFGANRAVLEQYGEHGRVGEINRNGVNLARESIHHFKETQGSELEPFLLGSIGPPPAGFDLGPSISEVYREQLEALLESGVDALLLETFTSLADLVQILGFIRDEFHNTPPLIAEMAVRRATESGQWNFDPVEFIEAMAQFNVSIAGTNCCAPWEATSFIGEVESHDLIKTGEIMLSAMPNGGGFQRIGNRYMTQVNPEYMGKLSRTLLAKGVRLIGGCCEVHPAHIREMYGYLQSRRPSRVAASVLPEPEYSPTTYQEKALNGEFSRKIFSDEFAVSVEILPPRGTSQKVLQQKIEFLKALSQSGLADAVDITDGSRGIPLIPPGDFISVIRQCPDWMSGGKDRLELIPHFTSRDLNVMGLQSRLMGLHVLGIHNVLFITGDPPKMSPNYPRSTAVFDLDSVDLIRFTHSYLNAGTDFGGRPLARDGNPRTRFTIGTGFEPETLNRNHEIEKLQRKLDAGADYVMTQPVFRMEPLETLRPFRTRIPILPGVMILLGLEHAKRITEVPGVVIPESVFQRFSKFESPEDQLKAGIQFASEQVQKIKNNGWSGLYLMSPASSRGILEVLEAGLS